VLFSSPFFLFLYLPLTLLLIAVFSKKYHNHILLLLSLAFYVWGGLYQTSLFISSIIINYLLGRLIGESKRINPKLSLAIAVTLNLLALCYFKYFNFFIENVNHLIPSGIQAIQVKKVLLPLGISFFTFHSISYLVDVYLKKVKPQKNIIDLSLYISFFPQLIAGPIVRYIDVSEQLQNRILTIPNVAIGMQRFIFGLAKKVIVANTLALLADKIINAPIDTISSVASWLGIAAYTMQIYFDFSGYSDMAIGLALICGFKFPENFNYPYASRSIKEFWRRWHISLSTWFRDFLYIPLGGNRLGNARTNINLFIVFFFTGLWHGASWCFIFWGLFHGIFLFLERTKFRNLLSRVPNFLQVFYTILIVMIGWVFFRIENIKSAIDYLSRMFYLTQQETNLAISLEGILNKKTIVVLVFAILYSLRFFRYLQDFTQRKFNQLKKENTFKISFQITKLIVSITLFFVTILYMTSSTYSPFIYFRF